MRTFTLLFVVVAVLMTSCAAPATPLPSVTTIPAPATPTREPPASATTPQASGAATPTSLRDALVLVDTEVRAAQSAGTIAEVRRHAEAALNMLVGQWGRWYGDADGDGTVDDPLKGVGILPGERAPGPAPDVGNPVSPFGLALAVYSAGGDANKQAVATMLGDVAQWQSSPRTGYDAIANAIDTSDAQASAVGKLAGSLPRVVAYMRLALTRANSPAEASGYLQRAATDSSAAVAAAGK